MQHRRSLMYHFTLVPFSSLFFKIHKGCLLLHLQATVQAFQEKLLHLLPVESPFLNQSSSGWPQTQDWVVRERIEILKFPNKGKKYSFCFRESS